MMDDKQSYDSEQQFNQAMNELKIVIRDLFFSTIFSAMLMYTLLKTAATFSEMFY